MSAIRRSIASSSPMVSSATAAALRPGTLETNTPLAAAASVSMVLVPAPARITRTRRSAASKTARGTAVLRTTNPSKPGDAPRQLLGRQLGLHHADVARASSSAIVCSGRRSANSRCIKRLPGCPRPSRREIGSR